MPRALAEIATRIGFAAAAIFDDVTIDGPSDLDLVPRPSAAPWDAVSMGAHSWLRRAAQC